MTVEQLHSTAAELDTECDPAIAASRYAVIQLRTSTAFAQDARPDPRVQRHRKCAIRASDNTKGPCPKLRTAASIRECAFGSSAPGAAHGPGSSAHRQPDHAGQKAMNCFSRRRAARAFLSMHAHGARFFHRRALRSWPPAELGSSKCGGGGGARVNGVDPGFSC